MNIFFNAVSALPNFPGKLRLANLLFDGRTNIQTKKTSYNFSMSIDLADRIQRRIFIKGKHEPETEIHLINLAKDSKCFLDIGANVGFFSLLLKKQNPSLEVHSFEPMPRNIAKLQENSALNHFDLSIHPICLSDREGEVEFAIPPLGECGWGRIAQGDLVKDFNERVKVKTATIDSLLSKDAFKSPPDLIKIDVEGSEMLVLNGAKNLLEKHCATFCIEINEECLLDNGVRPEDVFSFMHNYGYRAYYIDGINLTPTNGPVSGYKWLNYFFKKV